MIKFLVIAGSFMLFSSINAMENIPLQKTEPSKITPEQRKQNILRAQYLEIDADPAQENSWLKRFDQIERALEKAIAILRLKNITRETLVKSLNLSPEKVDRLLGVENVTLQDLGAAFGERDAIKKAQEVAGKLLSAKNITPDDIIQAFNLKDLASFEASGLPKSAGEILYFKYRLSHDETLKQSETTDQDISDFISTLDVVRNRIKKK